MVHLYESLNSRDFFNIYNVGETLYASLWSTYESQLVCGV